MSVSNPQQVVLYTEPTYARARVRSHTQLWDLLITLSRNINHKHTYTHPHVYKYPTYALSQVFQCVSPQSSFGVRP